MGYAKPEFRSYTTCGVLEEFGPGQMQYDTTTATLNPTASPDEENGQYVDGFIVKDIALFLDGEVRTGDVPEDIGIRGFVGFNISSIQSTVVSATLKVYQFETTADDVDGASPYGDSQLGTLVVDHVNFGDSLDLNDYDSSALTSNIGTISTDATAEWKTLDVTSYVQADLDAGRTSSQFRLRFTTETDSTGSADYADFESVEDEGGTGNYPELEVEYR